MQDEGIDSSLLDWIRLPVLKRMMGICSDGMADSARCKKGKNYLLKVQSGILHAREEVDILLADGTKAKVKSE